MKVRIKLREALRCSNCNKVLDFDFVKRYREVIGSEEPIICIGCILEELASASKQITAKLKEYIVKDHMKK